MKCPICLENITDDKKKLITSCNHFFHLDCIKLWTKTQLYINKYSSCPMCRNEIFLKTIQYKNDFKNSYYETKKYVRKSCLIDGINVFYLNKQLLDQSPKAWVDLRDDLFPLYKLDINNETIYITSFFRAYLLFSKNNKNIKKIKFGELKDEFFYDLDKEEVIVGKLTNRAFILLFEWCIQVLHLIKKDYNILYQQYINTILIDLSIYSIIELNLENNRDLYQGIFACSMFNIINKFSKLPKDSLPKIEVFIEYTNNIYNLEELKEIINVQKNYLKNNIIIL